LQNAFGKIPLSIFFIALCTSSFEADTPRWSYLCEEIIGKYNANTVKEIKSFFELAMFNRPDQIVPLIFPGSDLKWLISI
jgi:hypothetical protein